LSLSIAKAVTAFLLQGGRFFYNAGCVKLVDNKIALKQDFFFSEKFSFPSIFMFIHLPSTLLQTLKVTK